MYGSAGSGRTQVTLCSSGYDHPACDPGPIELARCGRSWCRDLRLDGVLRRSPCSTKEPESKILVINTAFAGYATQPHAAKLQS